MKSKHILKLISLLLAVLFTVNVLAGCGNTAEPEDTEEEPENIIQEEIFAPSGLTAQADDKFTLRYTASESLNPLRCENAYNDAVTSLIYEGLFRLDENFYPVPVLCEKYTTNDGLSYTFDIIDTKMHDGSKLTSEDVVYSINQARIGNKFARRLGNIAFCGTDGENSVYILLYNADYSLPALLDIPVIKSGSIDVHAPAGTGAYRYKNIGGRPCLTPFENYRTEGSAAVERIYLQQFTDASVEESFANYTLDCIWEDTAGETPVNLYSDHEARYYDTAILQYIGFNSSTPVLKDPNIRLAIQYAVNREQIVDEIYEGDGREAPLIFNSAHYIYSEEWEEGFEYSTAKISSYLASSGLDDKNSDGYLEYPVNGDYQYFDLRLLVCSDNGKKVDVAENIAASLKSVGVKIIVKALPWNKYREALDNGEFDLYYAEVSLRRNFDFGSILGADGYLDYGEMGSEEAGLLCSGFLTATTEDEKRNAAIALCTYVAENAIIVPVMYRQYVVYTHRGVISNFTPSVSGVFGDATGWTVRINDED